MNGCTQRQSPHAMLSPIPLERESNLNFVIFDILRITWHSFAVAELCANK